MKEVIVAIIGIICIDHQVFKVGSVGYTDFEYILKSEEKYFIDKTLFIEDFLGDDQNHHEQVKIITAPVRFGKTTIMKMLKRFAEIVPEEKLNATSNLTDSYELFCEPPLKICTNRKTFVEKHLGKHPVILIDYAPLVNTVNYESMLYNLREVIALAYEEFKYLEDKKELWSHSNTMNKEMFQNCANRNLSISENDIRTCLIRLVEIVSTNFGRKVIILIDEYSSYFNSVLYGNLEDLDKVVNIIADITRSLFKENPYLHKALLTGNMPVRNLGVTPTGDNVAKYRFLGDHKFSKYYGFTQEEIDELLVKNVIEEGRKVIGKILKYYYGGYRTRTMELYNPWSVINCIDNDIDFGSHWIYTNYIDNAPVNAIYEDRLISNEINKLVLGGAVFAFISQPLHKNVFLAFKEFKTVHMKTILERFMTFLFHVGLLTTRTESYDHSLTPLVIPNGEILGHFSPFLVVDFISHFKTEDAKALYNGVDSFKPEQNSSNVYKEFFPVVNNLLKRLTYQPKSAKDLYAFIFAILADSYPVALKTVHLPIIRSNVTCKNINNLPTTLKNPSESFFNVTNLRQGKTTDVVVINEHQVAIIMKSKFKTVIQQEKKLLDFAKDGLVETLITYNPDEINSSEIVFKNLTGTVCIALAYDEKSTDIILAFYSPTFDQEPTFLTKESSLVKHG